MCINNSTGERCEDCEEWFYGDAVEAKNCQGQAQNSELPTQKLIQHNTNLYSCITSWRLNSSYLTTDDYNHIYGLKNIFAVMILKSINYLLQTNQL